MGHIYEPDDELLAIMLTRKELRLIDHALDMNRRDQRDDDRKQIIMTLRERIWKQMPFTKDPDD